MTPVLGFYSDGNFSKHGAKIIREILSCWQGQPVSVGEEGINDIKQEWRTMRSSFVTTPSSRHMDILNDAIRKVQQGAGWQCNMCLDVGKYLGATKVCCKMEHCPNIYKKTIVNCPCLQKKAIIFVLACRQTQNHSLRLVPDIIKYIVKLIF